MELLPHRKKALDYKFHFHYQFKLRTDKQQTGSHALLEVLDGVYSAADDKQISVLIGLDLSAAFDTVDTRY